MAGGAGTYPYCQAQRIMHTSQQTSPQISNATTYASSAATTDTTRIIVGGVVLIVELAETTAVQQNGLSGRLRLPTDHGMLFVFNHQDYWNFWMLNMRFPLDIIWFNCGGQAIFVKQGLPPCTSFENCPIFTPTSKAMYVLEVDAGFVGAHNISLGNSFVFLDRLLLECN